MKRRQNVEQTTGPRRSTWIAPIAERSSDAPRRSIQHKNVLSTSEPTSKNPSSSASTDGGSGRGRPEETIETPTTGRRLRRFIAGGSALASVGALVAGTLMPTTSLITADSFAGAIPSQSFFTGGTGDDSGLLNVPAELPTAIATPEIQFNGGTVSVTGLTNTELRYPFDQEMLLTDGFGYRSAPVSGFHDAQDMAAAGGTPIRVVGDGMITEAGWASDGCGFSLKVQHQVAGKDVTSRYCHMQENSHSWQVGQMVRGGDQAGLVGNTGLSFGDHLHLVIRVEDEPVDPLPFIAANSK